MCSAGQRINYGVSVGHNKSQGMSAVQMLAIPCRWATELIVLRHPTKLGEIARLTRSLVSAQGAIHPRSDFRTTPAVVVVATCEKSC